MKTYYIKHQNETIIPFESENLETLIMEYKSILRNAQLLGVKFAKVYFLNSNKEAFYYMFININGEIQYGKLKN